MGLLNLNKLEKMKILVYDSPKRAAFFPQKFEVMFNPESYSLAYENKYSPMQGINTSGRPSRFALSPPSSMNITLLFDGTGVHKIGSERLLEETFSSEDDVYMIVQKFLSATTVVNGKIHEPNFLKLDWGDLSFDCRLKRVSVRYTLFDKSGKPLRAELDCVFVGDLEPSKRRKIDNFSSPDLTHRRTVKAGDDLLLLTHEIYGSPDWYIKVAKANNLDHFRNLIPGQELIFPPIKDIEA